MFTLKSVPGEESRRDPLLRSCFGISPARRLTEDDDATDDQVVNGDSGDNNHHTR